MALKQYSKEDALKYRDQGLTHAQIAEMMGCSTVWVAKAIAGVPKGMNRVKVDDTKLRAVKLAKEFLRAMEKL